LSRKSRSGELSQDALRTKLSELNADWQLFAKVDVSEKIIGRAAALAEHTGLRGADAVHLASAELAAMSLTGSTDRVVLVTSDVELPRAAVNLGLEVLDPQAGP